MGQFNNQTCECECDEREYKLKKQRQDFHFLIQMDILLHGFYTRFLCSLSK